MGDLGLGRALALALALAPALPLPPWHQVVLVGDQCQLPPTITSRTCELEGTGVHEGGAWGGCTCPKWVYEGVQGPSLAEPKHEPNRNVALTLTLTIPLTLTLIKANPASDQAWGSLCSTG